MNRVNQLEDRFESILDCRKIVLLTFFHKNGVDILNECGFLDNDIDRL